MLMLTKTMTKYVHQPFFPWPRRDDNKTASTPLNINCDYSNMHYCWRRKTALKCCWQNNNLTKSWGGGGCVWSPTPSPQSFFGVQQQVVVTESGCQLFNFLSAGRPITVSYETNHSSANFRMFIVGSLETHWLMERLKRRGERTQPLQNWRFIELKR